MTIFRPVMDESFSHDRQRRFFFWGMILTGTLSIPLIICFINAFRGIFAEKATGLAAVAGGLAEAYVTLGVVLSLGLPVIAIVLLLKSFSAGHRMRGLTLALAGLFVWGALVYLPRTAGVAR